MENILILRGFDGWCRGIMITEQGFHLADKL